MATNPKESRLPFTVQRDLDGGSVELSADPFNSRIKLKSYEGKPHLAAQALIDCAKEHGYGKAIAYVRKEEKAAFAEQFVEEGYIPGFFKGVDAYCMCAYLEPERQEPRDQAKADEIISIARAKEPTSKEPNPHFSFRQARKEDCTALAKLYQAVFGDSYPTPLSDPTYVREAMLTGSVFWLAMDGDKLCGAASLETDSELGNAEVTDCAVYSDYRGQGLLADLVEQLERAAVDLDLSCLYSLSRALLPGINVVLAAAGYSYCGRLINNCRICGGYEDMNIWQKFISR